MVVDAVFFSTYILMLAIEWIKMSNSKCLKKTNVAIRLLRKEYSFKRSIYPSLSLSAAE